MLGVVAGSVAGSLGDRVRPGATGVGDPAAGTGAGGPQGSGDTTEGASDFAPLASLPVEGAREAVVGDDGATVYLAVEDGFAAVDVSDPSTPKPLAERRGLLEDDSGESMREVQDVSVEDDRLLVMGPAHPGVAGPKAAILYDVTDPADPRRLAVHRTAYPIHNGTLRDGLAYLTANDGETNPMVVLEVEPDGGEGTGRQTITTSGASSEPRVIGRWSIVDADDAWADVPAQLRPIHDVIVHGTVAYCSYWDAGTWIVDVSDPTAPEAIGRVGDRSAAELADVAHPDVEDTELPGNHHSAALDGSSALLAVGHEAWDDDGDGDGGPGGIDLVDVSNPASPVVRSTVEPPPTTDPSRSGGVWTTAHNFELRDGRLYSAWYQGGVRVHDVSDPAAPREVAAWSDPSTTRFWTAQVADGARAGAEGGAGEKAIVASSANVDGDDAIEGGLYTFPDPDASPDPDAIADTDATGAPSPSQRRVTATPGLAGFGVGTALAGGAVAWLLARHRRE